MDFKTKLSQRIGMKDIHEILYLIQQNEAQKEKLYKLVLEKDENIAYYTAWIFTHFSPEENKWLYSKQNELINEVLVCKHGGKRRVLLQLLYKQPFANPPRVDFLDFCLKKMVSVQELPGVQSLCMKIAYELCRSVPELMAEFKLTLEMLENNSTPAIRTVRRNILKAMEKGKSLQKLHA
ncbi:MAG: hypothetical protein LUG18_10660 [Candidatus Azobacteroides sp.]|nr:hypothetical protein [Candidatus Azobacteroides sp.]